MHHTDPTNEAHDANKKKKRVGRAITVGACMHPIQIGNGGVLVRFAQAEKKERGVFARNGALARGGGKKKRGNTQRRTEACTAKKEERVRLEHLK